MQEGGSIFRSETLPLRPMTNCRSLHRRSALTAGLAAAVFPSMSVAGTPQVVARAGSNRAVFRSDRVLVETVAGPSDPLQDVVLIPGLASTGEIWRRTARRLSARHRVHIVTVRGFGEIAAGANGSGSLSAPIAAELGRYVREQRLRRPALIGHSLGGQLALRLAADQPRRIGRLMVVDASPFFPALISANTRVADVEPVAQIVYQSIQFLGDDALASRGQALGVNLGGASDALFNAVGWQGGDRRVLSQALYEAMTQDLRPRLPSITAPVTVVYGWSTDQSTPRARADALFRQAFSGLPTPARFEPIDGAEHMVMLDRFDPFMAAVDRFLA